MAESQPSARGRPSCGVRFGAAWPRGRRMTILAAGSSSVRRRWPRAISGSRCRPQPNSPRPRPAQISRIRMPCIWANFEARLVSMPTRRRKCSSAPAVEPQDTMPCGRRVPECPTRTIDNPRSELHRSAGAATAACGPVLPVPAIAVGFWGAPVAGVDAAAGRSPTPRSRQLTEQAPRRLQELGGS